MADGSKKEQPGTGGAPVDRGGSQPRYDPNDDRANVKNSNHPSHAADQNNRGEQKKRGS